MPSEPKPVRIALRSFPPASAKVGLLLEAVPQAAGRREVLISDGRIDEDDVVASAADHQHVRFSATELSRSLSKDASSLFWSSSSHCQ
eukprot:1513524-Pleurochrysis_carterae.AAC.2